MITSIPYYASFGSMLRVDTLNENENKIIDIANAICTTVKNGGKILICGNGGSAGDSQHFAAELVGRFTKERIAYPAIALTTDSSILTAVANDYSYDDIFSRQVSALARENDVVIGISTSGNSKNVVNAIKMAKERKCKTFSLLGNDGGQLKNECDVSIIVKNDKSYYIQEIHIAIIHLICKIVEEQLNH